MLGSSHMNAMSRLETVQLEREQTPKSKNLRRWGKFVLRSKPMEGYSSSVFCTACKGHISAVSRPCPRAAAECRWREGSVLAML